MLDRLTPDSLTIIASYVAVIELHICVTHKPAVTPTTLPRWDDDFKRSQAFMRRFGSYRHPLPWHVRTSPHQDCWYVFFYTSHLDLGALLRLAAIAKPLVKPMARLSQHVPVINVRHMPQYSNTMCTDFGWQKFTHCHGNSCPDYQLSCGVGLEICRIDYKLLPRLCSQRSRAPAIFYAESL